MPLAYVGGNHDLQQENSNNVLEEEEKVCQHLYECLESVTALGKSKDTGNSASENVDDESAKDCFDTLLMSWLRTFNMSAEPLKDKIVNPGHVYGQALSTYAYTVYQDDLASFNLQQSLGSYSALVCMHDEALCEMSWQQTQDVLMSLQIHFTQFFEFKDDLGGKCCECAVDLKQIMTLLFARLGFFAMHKWRDDADKGLGTQAKAKTPASASTALDTSVEVMHGVVDIDEHGWKHVREESMVFVLDALHAMFVAHDFLLSAQPIVFQGDEGARHKLPVFLFNHHREASLDDFYDLSMMADCPIGSILQYKHRFRYLFHSVSQVIFFHYPTYERQKQLSMDSLHESDVPGINLLPLLMQVKTEIPVLTEHTGLGNASIHAKHEWCWALIGKVVLLVNKNMEVLYAKDLRHLMLFLDPDLQDDT